MTPAVLDEALGAAGIDGSLRAETLEPQRFLALAEAFSQREGST